MPTMKNEVPSSQVC